MTGGATTAGAGAGGDTNPVVLQTNQVQQGIKVLSNNSKLLAVKLSFLIFFYFLLIKSNYNIYK